jgi:hypothetical protein
MIDNPHSLAMCKDERWAIGHGQQGIDFILAEFHLNGS